MAQLAALLCIKYLYFPKFTEVKAKFPDLMDDIIN